MRQKLFPALMVLLLVTACTTTSTANYEGMLNTWLGKSEREMIAGWGIPDKQYKLDANTKMVSYVSRRTVVYPGSVSGCFGGGYNPVFNACNSFPPDVTTYDCETIFTLSNGAITKWGHKGNDCRL
jgi:hypothetical protein